MNLKTKWAPAMVASVAAVFVIVAYVIPWPWTGWPTDARAGRPYKTLWDWLDLLVVPIALAGLGFMLSRLEKRAEQASAEARARSDSLQSYLDQMSALLLDNSLLNSAESSPMRVVARARTLAVLKRQDGAGRGVVLQFLYESQLIGHVVNGERVGPVVSLAGADLRDAHADGLELEGAELTMVDLSNARLRGADLKGAKLNGAKMRGADLRAGYPLWTQDFYMVTTLLGANLRGTDLTGARVEATFDKADLYAAKLNDANLTGSHLHEADLQLAEMERANWGGLRNYELFRLARAKTLEGATLPNGSKALAPQKLDLKLDDYVSHAATDGRARMIGEAKGEFNVLPDKHGDHVVGMLVRFYHHAGNHVDLGLLATDLDSGDQWISDSELRLVLTIPAETNVVPLELDVPLHSRNGRQSRSVCLTCELVLEATGRLKSWSLTNISVS